MFKSIENIDTLVISFDFDKYDELLRPFINDLEVSKGLAADSDIRLSNKKIYVDMFGSKYQILGNGTMGYSFILHSDYLEIKVARFRSQNKNIYPIMVRWKSELLWEKGLNSYFYVVDKLQRYFGVPVDEKISRLDMAFHVDGLMFITHDVDNFVGRHRKDSVHRKDRKVQTIYIGSRKTQTVMLRIYNKSQMILEERQKEWFFDIWNRNGMNISNVWNVEFELHREFLKQIKVNTFDDLTRNINELWHYLTNKWVRHVIPDSATRRENCMNTPFWDYVQTGFTSMPLDGFIEREVMILRDQESLLPSLVGYVTSYCAKNHITDIDDAMRLMRYEVPRHIQKKGMGFDGAVQNKMTFYHQIAELIKGEVAHSMIK